MPRNHKAEIRKDYFLDKYVVITPKRAKRPRDIKEETIVEARVPCPFCRENIDKKLIVDWEGDKKNWKILTVKNKFPALTLENPKAYGQQEVIIETPRHNVELGELSVPYIDLLLNVYAKRTKKIAHNSKIEYILIFKNFGGKAGASIFHAHSQIFASQILPPDVMEELSEAHKYQIARGSCPYCDIITKEGKGVRRIFADKNVVAFAPYASAYHYEAWVFTRRHVDNITHINKAEKRSFAKALKLILSKLDSLKLSYNYFFHQVIRDPDQHFYLKIQPRDSIWAGVELGSGVVINSVTPERAAKFYRE